MVRGSWLLVAGCVAACAGCTPEARPQVERGPLGLLVGELEQQGEGRQEDGQGNQRLAWGESRVTRRTGAEGRHLATMRVSYSVSSAKAKHMRDAAQEFGPDVNGSMAPVYQLIKAPPGAV